MRADGGPRGGGRTVLGLRGCTRNQQRALSDRFTATSDRLVTSEMQAQLAGRWGVATMSEIFGVIPALLHLAAGLPRPPAA